MNMNSDPRPNSNLLPWIFTAIFGAGFMLVLGMFLMYVWMQGVPVAQPVSPPNVAPIQSEVTETERATPSAESIDHSDPSESKTDSQQPAETLADLPAPQKELLVNDGARFSYEWTEPVVYNFSLHVKQQSNQDQFSGRTTYTPIPDEPTGFVEDLEQRATGTGFVIHPQGLIMTCAHVVGEAGDVSVTIDDSEITATVIAIDRENDLALLRIPRPENELHYLPIAPIESVEQGGRVRVFGFPLTDLLGSSMKISSGTITGFSDETNEVQIDATVNPGNSGGPVLDDENRVVGVASTLLDGRGMSNVGLAVGVEKIADFIRRGKLPFATQTTETNMKDIKKAVVFIQRNSESFVGAGQSVRFHSYYSPKISVTGPGGIRYNTAGNRITNKGIAVFDSRGMLGNDNSKQGSLPMTLQKLCQIGVEQLPFSANRKSWTESEAVVIRKTRRKRSQRGHIPGMPPGFSELNRHPFFSGRRQETVSEETSTIVATQTARYEIISDDEKELVIQKTFSVTPESADKKFSLNYAGKYRFDKVKKRITEGEFKGKTISGEGTKAETSPFTLKYKFVSQEQLKKEEADRIARAAARAKETKEREQRKDQLTVPALDAYDPKR